MLTEHIELTEEDLQLLKSASMPGEKPIETLRRLLAGIEIKQDIAAERSVQHPYEYD